MQGAKDYTIFSQHTTTLYPLIYLLNDNYIHNYIVGMKEQVFNWCTRHF